MRMKKACEATALTERAVRLYLSKGLITPQQTEGLLDFSAEDIQQLKDIAILRQFDFSLEQIASMLQDAERIPQILQSRVACAQAALEHENEVQKVLAQLEGQRFDDLHSLATQIREQRSALPIPDFGQFDEISDEEREQEQRIAAMQVRKAEKRGDFMGRVRKPVLILLGLLVCAIVFLSLPRIKGYVSVAPLSIEQIEHGESMVTVSIINPDAAALLGRDTITVPFRVLLGNVKVGDTVENACQLAIELSNYDLLKMGINPFQSFRTRDAAIHNEWMKLILHSMFEHGLHSNSSLWIREISNQRPLMW